MGEKKTKKEKVCWKPDTYFHAVILKMSGSYSPKFSIIVISLIQIMKIAQNSSKIFKCHT